MEYECLKIADCRFQIADLKSATGNLQSAICNLQSHWAALFAWGVWLTLLAMATSFVWHYAPEAPGWDEWHLTIPVLTGQQRLTPEVLWAQHNEHRLPLVKLLLLPLLQWTGGWFRGENYLNVVILAALAGGLMALVARLRGRYSYADAFIPLALLHLGHAEAFASRVTLGLVLAMALSCAVLALLVAGTGSLTLRRTLLLGLVLLALPLCAANGLPAALAGSVWLGNGGLRAWRSQPVGQAASLPRRSGQAAILFILALATAVLCGLYFVGYRPPPHHPPPTSMAAFLKSTAQCLSISVMPWGHLRPSVAAFLAGLLVPALVLMTGGLLVRTWLKSPGERGRALGLLLFLGSAVGVALGIGWGRAGLGALAGTAPRYATITVPAVLAVYVAWALYGTAPIQKLVPLGLFALFCLTLPLQTTAGLRVGRAYQEPSSAFMREMRDGAPPHYLARRYAGRLFPDAMAALVEVTLPRLQQARIGGFACFPAPVRSLPRLNEAAEKE